MIIPLATSELDNRSHLLTDASTRRGVIVDPSFDVEPIERAVAEQGIRPEAILLTHGHIDHIAGIPRLSAGRKLPVWIHADDAPLLRDGFLNGAMLFGLDWKPLEPDRLLREGEVIALGDLSMRVLHTPGHTPGGITIDVNRGEALIVGDTLFRGSVGRTDLPGGDPAALAASLRRLLAEFDDPPVFPGHGEATTLEAERRANPFLQGPWLA